MKQTITTLLAIWLAFTGPAAVLSEPSKTTEDKLPIVTLGDSITRGARPGVKADETFATLIQKPPALPSR